MRQCTPSAPQPQAPCNLSATLDELKAAEHQAHMEAVEAWKLFEASTHRLYGPSGMAARLFEKRGEYAKHRLLDQAREVANAAWGEAIDALVAASQ